MPNVSTGSTKILYGSSLKIGYRISGSTAAFTYLSYNPVYTELPYTFNIPSTGTYEIEYTELCVNCSGYSPSTSQTVTVTLT